MKIEWVDEGYELVRFSDIPDGTAFAMSGWAGENNIFIKTPHLYGTGFGKVNCVNATTGTPQHIHAAICVHVLDAKIVAKKRLKEEKKK